MKKRYKKYSFDFGGVLLKIDTKRTAAAMKDLIGVDLMQLSPDHPTASYLPRFEKGEISTETFFKPLSKNGITSCRTEKYNRRMECNVDRMAGVPLKSGRIEKKYNVFY